MHEHGLIANYADYLALPLPVVEHARLVMEAEGHEAKRQHAKAEAAEARSRRGGIRA